MEKETWINEVMESTRGMNPVEANPFLFEKIQFRMEARSRETSLTKVFSKGWAIAAVLLLALNIVSFTYMLKDSSQPQKQSGYQALAKEMGLSNMYNY